MSIDTIYIIGSFASCFGGIVSAISVYFFFRGIKENREITQKIEILEELSYEGWKYRFEEWLYQARSNPRYIMLKKGKYCLSEVGLKLIDSDLEDKITKVLEDSKNKKGDKVRLLRRFLRRLGITYLLDTAKEKNVKKIRSFLAVIAVYADEQGIF